MYTTNQTYILGESEHEVHHPKKTVTREKHIIIQWIPLFRHHRICQLIK